jgi:hypothetical protein
MNNEPHVGKYFLESLVGLWAIMLLSLNSSYQVTSHHYLSEKFAIGSIIGSGFNSSNTIA